MQESTTPDLAALFHRFNAAVNRRDFDAMMSFSGPDSEWDMTPWGLGTYRGPAAIRAFYEDWIGAYEDYEVEVEEHVAFGGGVVFTVIAQDARPIGSGAYVRLRYAAVSIWADGAYRRFTNYQDIDQARAAAERLAESGA